MSVMIIFSICAETKFCGTNEPFWRAYLHKGNWPPQTSGITSPKILFRKFLQGGINTWYKQHFCKNKKPRWNKRNHGCRASVFLWKKINPHDFKPFVPPHVASTTQNDHRHMRQRTQYSSVCCAYFVCLVLNVLWKVWFFNGSADSIAIFKQRATHRAKISILQNHCHCGE